MANVNINGKKPLLIDNTKTIRTKAYLRYFRYTEIVFLTNIFTFYKATIMCNGRKCLYAIYNYTRYIYLYRPDKEQEKCNPGISGGNFT
jgi:hypothetical protein